MMVLDLIFHAIFILTIYTDFSASLTTLPRIFTTVDLQNNILHSYHQPFCVLLQNKTNTLDKNRVFEEKLQELWPTAIENNQHQTGWKLGSYQIIKESVPFVKPPTELPHLRCYLGPNQIHEYGGNTSTIRLRTWLQQLETKYASYLSIISEDDIETSTASHDITLLIFPDNHTHITLENLAYQTCLVIQDCHVLIVHPDSTNFRLLQEKFNVRTIPSLIVIKKKDRYGDYEMKYFAGQEIQRKRLETCILSSVIKTPQFDKVNFKEKVITIYKSRKYVPYIVGFYAYWADDTHQFLEFFKTMIEDFQQDAVALRFGLVDLVEDRTVVQRYINSRHAEKVPFIILFQEDKGEVNQTLLPTNRPTSYSIYHACRYVDYDIIYTSGDVFVYEPYGRSESHQVCPQIEDPTGGFRCSTVYHNMTDYTVIYQHSRNITTNKTKNKKYATIHGMKKLTQFNWNDVLKKSLWASNLQLALNHAETSSVYMVIFIISDCSSCTRHLPTFQSLYKQVNTIAGSSFYIVNCTTDKTICNHHNITGYPTITAFRKILDQSNSHCFTQKQHTTDVRLDYHGPIQVKSVMEWYSSISMGIVKDMKFKPLKKIKEDVRLVAVIVPRNSSYLPIAPTMSNKKYYYGIECYRAICNQLISVVSCYSIYSIDIPHTQYQHKNNNNNNFIITQIRLERRDGIKADIMRLGESLYTTIQDETSQLHKIHKPHRYNLRQNQKCEEDHGMCSEFITSYVRDHIRLPVTHLTSVLFHTNNNPYKDNDLPVVIALVEPKHLEFNSTFLKILEDIGYEFYNRFMVVTLNVDMYPAWAGQFVPVGYTNTIQGNKESLLYVYPRLCIVNWNDHSHAAFYPSPHTDRTQFIFSKDAISKFLLDFLQQPNDYLIKTEHF